MVRPSPSGGSTHVRIGFVHAGQRGEVRVRVTVVEEPGAIGTPPGAAGFTELCGDVGAARLRRQIRRGPFRAGPLTFFGAIHVSGLLRRDLPTLFDAPSRDERDERDRTARSFLAPIDLFGDSPRLSAAGLRVEISGRSHRRAHDRVVRDGLGSTRPLTGEPLPRLAVRADVGHPLTAPGREGTGRTSASAR